MQKQLWTYKFIKKNTVLKSNMQIPLYHILQIQDNQNIPHKDITSVTDTKRERSHMIRSMLLYLMIISNNPHKVDLI